MQCILCTLLYLQEGADLLGEIQEALLPLVEGAGNGHGQPLADGLRVSLVRTAPWASSSGPAGYSAVTGPEGWSWS